MCEERLLVKIVLFGDWKLQAGAHQCLPSPTLPLETTCRSHCQLSGAALKAAIHSRQSSNSIFSLQFR